MKPIVSIGMNTMVGGNEWLKFIGFGLTPPTNEKNEELKSYNWQC